MKRVFLLSILLLAMLLACNLTRATPASPETILTEVLQASENCRSSAGVEAVENTASFFCTNSADTGYTVTLTLFESQATARAQFESGRGDNPVECFHGYDLYKVYSKNESNQFIVQEHLGWQAGPYLVSIYASYDYGYFHFKTIDFAEWIYTSALDHKLFPAGTCPLTETAVPLPASP
jgi:hypothetical protein